MNLEECLKPLIEDLKNDDIGLQAAFDRNLQGILSLKSQGFSYTRIFNKLNESGIDLKHPHYRTLLDRAQKKIGDKKVKTKTYTPTLNNQTTKPAKPQAIVKSPTSSQIDDEEEEYVFKYKEMTWRGVNVDNPNLMKDLEQSGYTPDDVANWKCANSFQIRNKLDRLNDFGET